MGDNMTVTNSGDGWESSQSSSYDDGSSDANNNTGFQDGTQGFGQDGTQGFGNIDPNSGNSDLAQQDFQQQWPNPMDGGVDAQKALEDFLAGVQQGFSNPFGGENSAVQGNGSDPTSQGCSSDRTFGAESGNNSGVQDAAIPATSSPNAMFA
jgi:hypothetical protein